MKKITILFLLLFTGACAFAQTRVEGTVTDAQTGDPLIGASVAIKGGGGGITDVYGKYTVSVADPAVAVLVFSYTGFETKEIPLQGRTRLDVKMGESLNMLDQVVVVGYGTQKKSDVTGSVGTVKAKDIERIATGSIDQALQGKVAGVYVSPSSGEPGAGAIIRVRGTGTLNNSNPIYVIDGMITYDASFVNPQDVESIEVLKDASACAIYGARGANGVILITTKTGRKRENAVISVSSYVGMQDITKQLNMMNASQFAQSYNQLVNKQYFPNPTALGTGTNWQNEIFRKAPISNVQLSANGGSDRFSYNVSGNYFNQDGILKNSNFKRGTVRFNDDFKVNDWLTLGNNLAYSSSTEQVPVTGAINSAYQVSPTVSPKDSTGTKFSDPTAPFGLAIANPVADLYYKNNHTQKSDRFFGTIFAEIKFLKDFTFKSNFGFDINNSSEKQYTPAFQVSASQLNKEDQLVLNFNQGRDWIWEQTLNYNHAWKNHKLNVLAGYTAEERRYESFGAGRRSFPGSANELLYLDAGNDTTQTNHGSAHDEALVSYLFRTNYTFIERYLLTVSVRVDQSSRFSAKNRTGTFPSFGVGWNAGQESFIERLHIFDRLKFRASYGLLGNQNSIRDRFYPSLGVITSGLYAIFGPGQNLNPGGTLINLGNPNLVWETASQTDAGIEFGLFKGHLQAEIDYYNRYTYDIIAPVPIPAYVGSASDPVVNTAKVRNRGWDITVNWRQTNGNFTWNVGALVAPVKNELVSLNDQKSEILAGFTNGEAATRSIPGQPIGSFYGYKVAGIFQDSKELASLPKLGDEVVGDLRFMDLNGDGKIDSKDRTNLGSPIPTLTYSFTAGIEWMGLDLNADMLGVSGNKVFNQKQTQRFSVNNWEEKFFNGFTDKTPSTTTPRISNGGHNYRVSDYFIEDGSFIRLRSIALGYSLPQAWLKKVKITKFRLYVNANNIWTKQKYSGYSPEFGNNDTPYEVGFDRLGYPVTKSFIFGLDLMF
jgi:TonB-linked SusC/RagA family outer membrane protein